MENQKKKEALQHLHGLEPFQKALGNIKDEAEKKKVKAFAEDIFINFLEGLSGLQRMAKEHPEELAEALKNRIPKK